MTLFAEAPPIPLHALAALLAFVLGGMQLAMKKGTRLHKALGWIWIGLMAVVAMTSFFIHEIRLWADLNRLFHNDARAGDASDYFWWLAARSDGADKLQVEFATGVLQWLTLWLC